ALVEEDAASRAGNGDVQIGVFENDIGRFPAQLKRDSLQIAGSSMNDEFADFSGTSERNLIDIIMGSQRSACGLAIPWHNVDDSFRESCFDNQFAQSQSGEWCLFSRLQHNRA